MEDENEALPQPEQINMKECLKINFLIFTVCGHWIPTNLRGKVKRYLYRTYSALCVIFLVISPVPTHVVDAVMVIGDLQKFVERMYFTVALMAYTTKVYVILRHHERIHKLLESFEEPIFRTVDVVSSETVRGTMRRHVLIVVALIIMVEITVSAFALFTFLRSDEMALPAPAWFPFDIYKSNRFMMVYIYQVIMTYCAAATNISYDCLIVGIMAMTCGQLDVLCDKLADKHRRRGLVQASDGHLVKDIRFSSYTAENETKKHLHNCIEHHLKIIRFVNDMEDIFGPVAFIQFIASCIILCFAAFQLTKVTTLIEVFGTVLFIVCVVSELFIICYFGNELIVKSQRVSMAAYESLWHERSLENSKYILIIMERAKRPLKVTAVFFTLSFDTFMTVIRTSYSYFAILQSVNNH